MKYIITICFLLIGIQSFSQTTDTVSVLKVKTHSASKAAKFSAIVPGLGQAYNKKYWKIPIIYAGAGALIYSVSWNNKQYQKYLTAYKLDSDTSLLTNSQFSGLYTVENLITLKDFYRRNRDFSVIGIVLLYAANIIDAYVDAQFYNFDISDDLSLNVKPFITPTLHYNQYGGSFNTVNGLSLTLRFK